MVNFERIIVDISSFSLLNNLYLSSIKSDSKKEDKIREMRLLYVLWKHYWKVFSKEILIESNVPPVHVD